MGSLLVFRNGLAVFLTTLVKLIDVDLFWVSLAFGLLSLQGRDHNCCDMIQRKFYPVGFLDQFLGDPAPDRRPRVVVILRDVGEDAKDFYR